MTYQNKGDQLDSKLLEEITINGLVRHVMKSVLYSDSLGRGSFIPFTNGSEDNTIIRLIMKEVLVSRGTNAYWLFIADKYEDSKEAFSDAIAYAEIPDTKHHFLDDHLGNIVKYKGQTGLFTLHAGEPKFIFSGATNDKLPFIYVVHIEPRELSGFNQGNLLLDHAKSGLGASVFYEGDLEYDAYSPKLIEKGLLKL